MALETTANRKEYAGNGVTTGFSFPYYFLATSDLVVILRNNTTGIGVIQTITTNYTVTGAGIEAGGTVTMLVAPPSGYTLIIYRDPSITQDKDFRENDSFPAEQAEQAWDRAAMIAQRLAERITRALGLSESFVGSFSLTLPPLIGDITSRGKSLVVNQTNDGIDLGLSTADVVAATAAAAASASASAGSASASAGSATAAAGSATASAGSATAAAGSASAAATSATAAQNAAAATLWRDVVFLTFADSPRTIVSADRGKMFAIDTSSGNVVLNLPTIAGLDLTSPFALGIKKTSTDGNSITVNRGGTDLIDGGTSKVLSVAQGGSTFIPDTDPSPDQWTTADFGAAAGNLIKNTFNGTGAQTAFTITQNPGSINNTFVFVDGVYQDKATYSLSGTTLTFTEAPPTGTNNVEVMSGTLLSIGTPSDGTVTNAKMAQMPTLTIKGNNTGGSATPVDLTAQQARDILYQGVSVQRFTAGSGTYTTPTGVKRLRIRMVGAGGGGGGAGNNVTPGGTGGAGSSTTFGSSLLTAAAGGGGSNVLIGGTGAGGSVTVSAPAINVASTPGADGNLAPNYDQKSYQPGANSTATPLGGGGPTSVANTGSGGAGGSTSGSVAAPGHAGGAGGYIEAIINSPSATYAYAIGTGGTAGTAGTGGSTGTAGAAGIIIVEEFYQ